MNHHHLLLFSFRLSYLIRSLIEPTLKNKLGIEWLDYLILKTIQGHSYSQCDILEVLCINKDLLSRRVRKLRKNNLIWQEKAIHDDRRRWLHTTSKGDLILSQSQIIIEARLLAITEKRQWQDLQNLETMLLNYTPLIRYPD